MKFILIISLLLISSITLAETKTEKPGDIAIRGLVVDQRGNKYYSEPMPMSQKSFNTIIATLKYDSIYEVSGNILN